MEFLTWIILIYSFIALYFLSLYLLVYLKNKDTMFFSPIPKKDFSLSIVIPCYNEGETIGTTIQNLLDSSYPFLKKIIVVDDCSKDNSYEIAKAFEKIDSRVVVVKTPKNTGRASGAKNYGAQFVDTELIGFTDADSFPGKDAISKMVGFFNDTKVGAVTSNVLAKNRTNFLSRVQAIEYKIMAFNRKMLGFVDSIYVTNGPLSIYSKKVFDKVHGFDESQLTEDIDITWNILKHRYLVCMSFDSKVYTVVPEKLGDWFKQRFRWNIGGIQVIKKYGKLFLRCGMLGLFVIPLFVSSWFLTLFAVFLFVYRFITLLWTRWLSVDYSIQAKTALFRFSELNISMNILIFLGIMIFFLGFVFFLISLSYNKEINFKKHSLFDFLGYLFIYPFLSPVLVISSAYKYLRGYNQW